MSVKEYTNEDIEKIVNLYNNGILIKDISSCTGIQDGNIICILMDLGLYKKNVRYNDLDLDFIINSYDNGNLDDIFTRYPFITYSSLYSKMNSLKVKSGKKGYWTDEDESIVEKYYNECSIEEIQKMIEYRHSKNSIISKALKKFGYSKSKKWTTQEDDILYKYYSTIPIDDIVCLLPNRSRNAIILRANNLSIPAMFYINTYWDSDDEDYLRKNYLIMTDLELANNLNKTVESIKNKRWSMNLLRINKDYQGYENTDKFLRGCISKWKNKSIKQCGGKCIISGSNDYDVHHLYSFKLIIQDFFNCYNFDYKDLDQYTKDEINKLKSKFVSFHDSYGLGVCIDKKLHKLFHEIYGKVNVKNQMDQFIIDYENNKYNND